MERASTARRILEERRVTVGGMVINVLLTVFKILVGVTGRSSAIIADGLHSGSDLASDIAVLWGIRAARRPADADHHFGHARYETIVTMFVGILLLAAALWVGIHSIATLPGKHPGLVSWLPFWAAVTSILLKETLYWVTRHVGRKYRNASIVANAWHHRSDAFSSVAAAAGIAGATIGGPNWAFLDHLTAVVLAAFLVVIGVRIVRDALFDLSDRAPDPASARRVHETISSIPGVVGFHACRARRSAGVIEIDVHVQVAPELTVRKGHDIATRVERDIRAALPGVTGVVVHIEPTDDRSRD